jgi:hypothetical protein
VKLAIGIASLTALVAGQMWFQFGQDDSAAYLARRARDILDPRPARTILVVGNSRTYYHDMPAMIRAIADSAGSPSKYEIEVDAEPGASFESLWAEARTRALLRQGWDEAIFQGESRGQSTEALEASFRTFGEKLIRAASLRGGPPRLVVNWAYDPVLYEGDTDGSERAVHRSAIRGQHMLVAEQVEARPIDVERLWETTRLRHAAIPLTEDGNHPTIAGSYLFALALYADLSGQDVRQVSYVPKGLRPADAETLRESVREFETTA